MRSLRLPIPTWAAATLLLLPLGAQEGSVTTNRSSARALAPPREEGVFHFVVFGDRTGGPDEGVRVLAQAVEDTNLLAPDLVMTVGDLVQGYNQQPQWLEQMREYREIMQRLRMPWYPVAGNHDVYWRGGTVPPGQHEGDYEEHFGPLWYWFAHKDCAFVVLYSDESAPGSNEKGFGRGAWNRIGAEQLEWLEETLAATRDKKHVFLFLHHPRWIASSYPGSNWDVVHAMLRAAGNVTAVFAGHIHRMRYEGKVDGIEYLTLATVGGSIPYDLPGTGHLHHYNVVSVRDRGIEIATIPVGAALDPRAFTPEYLAEIDRARNLAIRTSGELRLARDGSASGELRVALNNPAAHPVELVASLEFRGRGWYATPEKLSQRLEPGTSLELSFRCEREAESLDSFAPPALVSELSWLGSAARVDFPARRDEVAVDLGVFAELPIGDGELHLDGRSGAVRIDDATLSLPDGPFTLEAWFVPTDTSGRTGVVAKTESSEYSLFGSDGTPSFSVFLGDRYVTATGPEGALTLGQATHLAGVYDGSEVRLYRDGRLIGRQEGSGKRRTNALPLWIGADPDRDGAAGSFLGARFQGVRLGEGARYSGESIEVPPPATQVAGSRLHLLFDRAVGPFVIDRSGNGAHGRLQGGASIQAR